jgi:hypothetical protein
MGVEMGTFWVEVGVEVAWKIAVSVGVKEGGRGVEVVVGDGGGV